MKTFFSSRAGIISSVVLSLAVVMSAVGWKYYEDYQVTDTTPLQANVLDNLDNMDDVDFENLLAEVQKDDGEIDIDLLFEKLGLNDESY